MFRTRVRVGRAAGLVVSALLAALLTVIGALELFFPTLAPMYGEPAPLVLRIPYGQNMVRDAGGDVVDATLEPRRMVVPRGTVLRPDDDAHRAAVKWDELHRPPPPARLAAVFGLYLLGAVAFVSYVRRFGHGRLKLIRSQVGLFALVAALFVLAKALLLFTTLPAYWIPVSAVGLWAAVGFDRRTGVLVDITASVLLASLLRFDLLLLAVLLVRAIVTMLVFTNRKSARAMLVGGFVSGVAGAAAYAALVALFAGRIDILEEVARGASSPILACVGGGFVAGVLGQVLREPVEVLLGRVARSRLIDLTDIESPLLKKMASEAPGSWEHSRAMANLAEAASASIGADALLTRVGAYYHDLGKTAQPKYFVENMAPGEPSPHDELAPEVSADAIMAHVVIGTRILRNAGVPEPVVEFAYTHHGTQLVEYFWNKYREQTAELDESVPRLGEDHFRYPGMKPMSKETAILMLVDSIEAASRTIDPPGHEAFEEMIRRVVFMKLKSGQLDDSGLTLVDLRIMTERMAHTLVNMYHGRIKYPWQKKKEGGAAGVGASPSAVRKASEAP
jgi:cyclic-di-AMP phosphodiesterase PgpH